MDPFTLSLIGNALPNVTEVLAKIGLNPADILSGKLASQVAHQVVDLICHAFFNNLDIPEDKYNCVRDKLFGDPVNAGRTISHLVEDYLRGPGKGGATSPWLNQCMQACDMTAMDRSMVLYMWYMLWGSVDRAREEQWFGNKRNAELKGVTDGLSQKETDSLYQYFAMNDEGRAEWLQNCPPSKWTEKFSNAMHKAARKLGESEDFEAVKASGGDGGGGGGAGLPVALAAAAALAALGSR
jgi:hypothetical protein